MDVWAISVVVLAFTTVFAYPQDAGALLEDAKPILLPEKDRLKPEQISQGVHGEAAKDAGNVVESVKDVRREAPPFIPIIRFNKEHTIDGGYKTIYETGNKIFAEETGILKKFPPPHEHPEAVISHGSYSYTSPEGKLITVQYTADELGFRAFGEHLPTPPPVPEGIKKGLDVIYKGIHEKEELEHLAHHPPPIPIEGPHALIHDFHNPIERHQIEEERKQLKKEQHLLQEELHHLQEERQHLQEEHHHPEHHIQEEPHHHEKHHNLLAEKYFEEEEEAFHHLGGFHHEEEPFSFGLEEHHRGDLFHELENERRLEEELKHERERNHELEEERDREREHDREIERELERERERNREIELELDRERERNRGRSRGNNRSNNRNRNNNNRNRSNNRNRNNNQNRSNNNRNRNNNNRSNNRNNNRNSSNNRNRSNNNRSNNRSRNSRSEERREIPVEETPELAFRELEAAEKKDLIETPPVL